MAETSGQLPESQGSEENPDLMRMADERLKKSSLIIREAFPELQSTTSDRACVLISVSLIDMALEQLLRAKFMASSEVTEEECDFLLVKRPIPALGSTGIRVRLALAMGLINRETMKAISYAINFRNENAHKLNPQPLTWKVVNKLRSLLPDEHRKQIEEIERTAIEDYKNAGQPPPADPKSAEQLIRNTFARTCLDICLELNFQAILVELDPIHKAMTRARTSPQSGHRPMP